MEKSTVQVSMDLDSISEQHTDDGLITPSELYVNKSEAQEELNDSDLKDGLENAYVVGEIHKRKEDVCEDSVYIQQLIEGQEQMDTIKQEVSEEEVVPVRHSTAKTQPIYMQESGEIDDDFADIKVTSTTIVTTGELPPEVLEEPVVPVSHDEHRIADAPLDKTHDDIEATSAETSSGTILSDESIPVSSEECIMQQKTTREEDQHVFEENIVSDSSKHDGHVLEETIVPTEQTKSVPRITVSADIDDEDLKDKVTQSDVPSISLSSETMVDVDEETIIPEPGAVTHAAPTVVSVPQEEDNIQLGTEFLKEVTKFVEEVRQSQERELSPQQPLQDQMVDEISKFVQVARSSEERQTQEMEEIALAGEISHFVDSGLDIELNEDKNKDLIPHDNIQTQSETPVNVEEESKQMTLPDDHVTDTASSEKQDHETTSIPALKMMAQQAIASTSDSEEYGLIIEEHTSDNKIIISKDEDVEQTKKKKKTKPKKEKSTAEGISVAGAVVAAVAAVAATHIDAVDRTDNDVIQSQIDMAQKEDTQQEEKEQDDTQWTDDEFTEYSLPYVDQHKEPLMLNNLALQRLQMPPDGDEAETDDYAEEISSILVEPGSEIGLDFDDEDVFANDLSPTDEYQDQLVESVILKHEDEELHHQVAEDTFTPLQEEEAITESSTDQHESDNNVTSQPKSEQFLDVSCSHVPEQTTIVLAQSSETTIADDSELPIPALSTDLDAEGEIKTVIEDPRPDHTQSDDASEVSLASQKTPDSHDTEGELAQQDSDIQEVIASTTIGLSTEASLTADHADEWKPVIPPVEDLTSGEKETEDVLEHLPATQIDVIQEEIHPLTEEALSHGTVQTEHTKEQSVMETDSQSTVEESTEQSLSSESHTEAQVSRTDVNLESRSKPEDSSVGMLKPKEILSEGISHGEGGTLVSNDIEKTPTDEPMEEVDFQHPFSKTEGLKTEQLALGQTEEAPSVVSPTLDLGESEESMNITEIDEYNNNRITTDHIPVAMTTVGGLEDKSDDHIEVQDQHMSEDFRQTEDSVIDRSHSEVQSTEVQHPDSSILQQPGEEEFGASEEITPKEAQQEVDRQYVPPPPPPPPVRPVLPMFQIPTSPQTQHAEPGQEPTELGECLELLYPEWMKRGRSRSRSRTRSTTQAGSGDEEDAPFGLRELEGRVMDEDQPRGRTSRRQVHEAQIHVTGTRESTESQNIDIAKRECELQAIAQRPRRNKKKRKPKVEDSQSEQDKDSGQSESEKSSLPETHSSDADIVIVSGSVPIDSTTEPKVESVIVESYPMVQGSDSDSSLDVTNELQKESGKKGQIVVGSVVVEPNEISAKHTESPDELSVDDHLPKEDHIMTQTDETDIESSMNIHSSSELGESDCKQLETITHDSEEPSEISATYSESPDDEMPQKSPEDDHLIREDPVVTQTVECELESSVKIQCSSELGNGDYQQLEKVTHDSEEILSETDVILHECTPKENTETLQQSVCISSEPTEDTTMVPACPAEMDESLTDTNSPVTTGVSLSQTEVEGTSEDRTVSGEIRGPDGPISSCDTDHDVSEHHPEQEQDLMASLGLIPPPDVDFDTLFDLNKEVPKVEWPSRFGVIDFDTKDGDPRETASAPLHEEKQEDYENIIRDDPDNVTSLTEIYYGQEPDPVVPEEALVSETSVEASHLEYQEVKESPTPEIRRGRSPLPWECIDDSNKDLLAPESRTSRKRSRSRKRKEKEQGKKSSGLTAPTASRARSRSKTRKKPKGEELESLRAKVEEQQVASGTLPQDTTQEAVHEKRIGRDKDRWKKKKKDKSHTQEDISIPIVKVDGPDDRDLHSFDSHTAPSQSIPSITIESDTCTTEEVHAGTVPVPSITVTDVCQPESVPSITVTDVGQPESSEMDLQVDTSDQQRPDEEEEEDEAAPGTASEN